VTAVFEELLKRAKNWISVPSRTQCAVRLAHRWCYGLHPQSCASTNSHLIQTVLPLTPENHGDRDLTSGSVNLSSPAKEPHPYRSDRNIRIVTPGEAPQEPSFTLAKLESPVRLVIAAHRARVRNDVAELKTRHPVASREGHRDILRPLCTTRWDFGRRLRRRETL
jgi:hypothetical protein